MLTKIISDDQLKKLLSTSGFLVNIDYPTRDVKLHRIDCKYCNPGLSIGVKPSSKILNKTGEFWFSEKFALKNMGRMQLCLMGSSLICIIGLKAREISIPPMRILPPPMDHL